MVAKPEVTHQDTGRVSLDHNGPAWRSASAPPQINAPSWEAGFVLANALASPHPAVACQPAHRPCAEPLRRFSNFHVAFPAFINVAFTSTPAARICRSGPWLRKKPLNDCPSLYTNWRTAIAPRPSCRASLKRWMMLLVCANRSYAPCGGCGDGSRSFPQAGAWGYRLLPA